MLKILFAASRLLSRQLTAPLIQNVLQKPVVNQVIVRNFTHLNPQNYITPRSLLSDPKVVEIGSNIIKRSLIKFSYTKGKRKSVKAVRLRFYRLHWGAWIRTKCGRHKKLWKKSSARKRRLRQHVFCNATQSNLLDKMVGKYWTKPRYYVDDPYEPYHSREEFPFTAVKPKPFFPPEK
ncbi:Ribosomal L35p domain containing protein [Asbolus verrucosus]|uniref:Large ribosomal subunit protein bL35m n=1 Tax=Asbolus verrucosus TaxID=1661398 RepID=A0A482W1Y5_ASBVE|nr:Ribosomal L35p domain containing protein [Asbolus verrucosus]